ncbi:hypothetical protein BH11ACT8_BH11ACT8_13080 [soil metagenome]
MSLSMITVAALQAAEETHKQTIHPWIVGVIALGILLSLLLALVTFGGGRDHT